MFWWRSLIGSSGRWWAQGFDDLVAELIALGKVMIERADVDAEIVIAVRGQDAIREEVVIRLAICRQPHHLPLVAAEHVEAQQVGHRRIELAERMRKLDPL